MEYHACECTAHTKNWYREEGKNGILCEEGEKRHITLPYSTISLNFFVAFFSCQVWHANEWTPLHAWVESATGLTRATWPYESTPTHKHTHTHRGMVCVSGFNSAFNFILSAVWSFCLCALGLFLHTNSFYQPLNSARFIPTLVGGRLDTLSSEERVIKWTKKKNIYEMIAPDSQICQYHFRRHQSLPPLQSCLP